MQPLFTRTRPIDNVPGSVLVLLVITLISQCVWHAISLGLRIHKEQLPPPPDVQIMRLIGLDDMTTTARVLMLWLQAFDNQPGVSLSLKELDYDNVIFWLDTVLSLDPFTQYPLLAAIRFYAEVPVPEKQRQMIKFIHEKFLEAPNRRWPAMAHAVYIAKHQLKDKSLAVSTARLLREQAKADSVPFWAKQMEFFVLEDMGELEAAKVLIGGLLESGELRDSQQQLFLSERLQEIENRIEAKPSVPDVTQ